MKLLIVVIYVITSCHVSLIRCGKPEPTEDFPHYAVLDQDDKVWLYWKFNETYITFEIQGNSIGWVGIGISPNGGMIGADIYVGWVKNGKAYITDRHGESSNSFPPKDEEQNVELLEGRECDGWTVIKFQRQIVGCEDTHDITIGKGTVKMIWALGHSEPTGDDIIRSNYHGGGNEERGVKNLLLLESNAYCAQSSMEDTSTFETLNGNVEVPPKETYYSCRLLKLPELDSKHHIVKIEPVIQQDNLQYVHHMLVYSCRFSEPTDVSKVGTSHKCASANMPPDFQNCRMVFYGWAVGGGNFCLPPHVGFPIGPDEPRYILLETHYDNPEMRSGIVDNSGFRYHYTSQLRQYDGGILETGLATTSLGLIIPPNLESFNLYGGCSKDCLTNGMSLVNLTSINVFGTLLHTHLLGRQITLHHMDNDSTTELPTLAADLSYDFNYQEMKIFPKEIVINSGESLQVQCTYSSKSRTQFTVGGLGTGDEMCLAYLTYYPRIPLRQCVSLPFLYQFYAYFGIDYNDLSQHFFLESLEDIIILGSNQTLYTALNKENWTQEFSDDFSRYVQHIMQFSLCSGTSSYDQPNHFLSNPPNITQPYTPPVRNCIQPASGKPTMRSETVCSSTNPLQINSVLIAILSGILALLNNI